MSDDAHNPGLSEPTDLDQFEATFGLEQRCPTCGKLYPSDATRCPDDGAELVESTAAGDGAGDAADDATLSGATLAGRYSIERLLGEGGMGRVYAGRQLSVDRPVALKVIRQSVSGSNEVRKRFMREARVVSSFSHPNIVRIFDFGESDGHLFIAMEYVDGLPLSDLLPDGGLPPTLMMEIMDQVAGALVEAHDAGIVHRDIKPDNIMVTRTPDGSVQARLLDFGIAHIERKSHLADDDMTSLTAAGAVYGTPEYMAPEQVRGKTVGTYTDSYALGVVLYELATGHPPFRTGSPMHTMFMHVRDEPDLDRPGIAEYPELMRLIGTLMAKQPESRPQHARDVVRRIRETKRALDVGFVPPLDDGDLEEAFDRVIDELGGVRNPSPTPPEPEEAPPAVQPAQSNPSTPFPPGREVFEPGPPTAAQTPEPAVDSTPGQRTDREAPRSATSIPQSAAAPAPDRRRQLIWVAGATGLLFVVFFSVVMVAVLTRDEADAPDTEQAAATSSDETEPAGTETESSPDEEALARGTKKSPVAEAVVEPPPTRGAEDAQEPTEPKEASDPAGDRDPERTEPKVDPERTEPKVDPERTEPKVDPEPKEPKADPEPKTDSEPEEKAEKQPKSKPAKDSAEKSKTSDDEDPAPKKAPSDDGPEEEVDERLDEVVDWLEEG